MANVKHAGGRPRLTEEQKKQRKDLLVTKIEPYLKSGISINKALREAKIANSEFYKYMAEDEFFGEKIERFKQYTSILINSVLVNHLHFIIRKQNRGEQLTQENVAFLFWFAINNNLMFEEYGNRPAISPFDPEAELQKMEEMIANELSEKLSNHF